MFIFACNILDIGIQDGKRLIDNTSSQFWLVSLIDDANTQEGFCIYP